MDQEQQKITFPSPAEIERLIARGRRLRAEAVINLAKAMVGAIRRAFGRSRSNVGEKDVGEMISPTPPRYFAASLVTNTGAK